MSFTLVPNEAMDRMTELSAGAWRLYCFLLRCRNSETGRAFPSIKVSAEAISTHSNNVYRLRKELSAIGWVEFDGDEVKFLLGEQFSKNAKKSVDNAKDSATVADFSKNAKGFSNNAKKFSKNANAYKEQQYERTRLIEQDKDMSGAVAPSCSSRVQEVFAYWQERLKHPNAKLTPKRRRNIQTRLTELYTVENIKQAIDGCVSSPFHMGANQQGTVYDDIELICRSGEKLEMFMAKAVSPPKKQNGNAYVGKSNSHADEDAETQALRAKLQAQGIVTDPEDYSMADWIADCIKRDDRAHLAMERGFIAERGGPKEPWEHRVYEYLNAAEAV